MSEEVATNTPALNQDQVSWLLVAAYTYLQQNKPDESVTLLRFLRLLDRNNQQCLKMLAYAYLRQGSLRESLELIEEILQTPLSDEERTAMYLMRLRASRGNGVDSEQMSRDYIKQLALASNDGNGRHDDAR